MAVKQALQQLGIAWQSIDLGVIVTDELINDAQRRRLGENLRPSGLIMISDHKTILTERIKNAVTELVHGLPEDRQGSYAEYISRKLGYHYTYLSNLFTAETGMTIQKFIILNKVERIKELLLYNELNITEISYRMRYSSIGHLSNQFKRITGISPRDFRKRQNFDRTRLECL